MGISWVIVRIPTAYQEIATACGLAMTVVVWAWCFCIHWATIEHGRRGQCHTPYKAKGSIGEPFAAFGGWNATGKG